VRANFTSIVCKNENPHTGGVVLEATDDVFAEYCGFARLHPNCVWEGMWYTTCATAAPQAELKPSTVTAVPMKADPVVFWPLVRKPRKSKLQDCDKNKQRKAQPSAPSVIEDVANQDADQGNDEDEQEVTEFLELLQSDEESDNELDLLLDQLARAAAPDPTDQATEPVRSTASSSAAAQAPEVDAAINEPLASPTPSDRDSGTITSSSTSSSSDDTDGSDYAGEDAQGELRSPSDDAIAAVESLAQSAHAKAKAASNPDGPKQKAELRFDLGNGNLLWYYDTAKRFVVQCKHPMETSASRRGRRWGRNAHMPRRRHRVDPLG